MGANSDGAHLRRSRAVIAIGKLQHQSHCKPKHINCTLADYNWCVAPETNNTRQLSEFQSLNVGGEKKSKWNFHCQTSAFQLCLNFIVKELLPMLNEMVGIHRNPYTIITNHNKNNHNVIKLLNFNAKIQRVLRFV